jgi:hypothetical protein
MTISSGQTNRGPEGTYFHQELRYFFNKTATLPHFIKNKGEWTG